MLQRIINDKRNIPRVTGQIPVYESRISIVSKGKTITNDNYYKNSERLLIIGALDYFISLL